MNRDRAKLLLAAHYSAELIQMYFEAITRQFPNEAQYWKETVRDEKTLMEDMALFAEAHQPQETTHVEAQ